MRIVWHRFGYERDNPGELPILTFIHLAAFASGGGPICGPSGHCHGSCNKGFWPEVSKLALDSECPV